MFKKLQSIVRDYFGFSRMEMNGFFILIILMLLMVTAPLIFDQLYHPNIEKPSPASLARLDSVVKILNSGITDKNQESEKKTSLNQPQKFNPNKASQEKLARLGFKPWIAERIINYRKEVTSFQYKEDLLKVYDLSESTFKKLYAFIELPEKPSNTSSKKEAKEFEKVNEPFDLNKADTTQLKTIKGIGKVFANRIVKYRYLVGGYTNMGQLEEVYGLKPEVLKRLRKAAYINKKFIPRQIALNKATSRDLSRHPYLNNQMAASIVEYRENNGKFKNLSLLREIAGMDKQLFEKIKPYLTISGT